MNTTEKRTTLYRHAGQRIKARRKMLRITQSQLAELLGISYQQIQKYEAGANQISLERLLDFAKILNVAPEHFYEGIPIEGEIGIVADSDVIQTPRCMPLQVLLVEDNVADAMLFKKAAQEFGPSAAFHCISDPETVMDYLQHHALRHGHPAPDIIVLDLNFPKMSGLQLLKEIKSNSQTSILPTLMLTNSISKKEMHEAYRLGAAGFIQKSVDFQAYRESIEIILLYWCKVVALPAK
jgi:CheY-like chemotaxis protein/DNA-binding XRE family transcriptional regulator